MKVRARPKAIPADRARGNAPRMPDRIWAPNERPRKNRQNGGKAARHDMFLPRIGAPKGAAHEAGASAANARGR